MNKISSTNTTTEKSLTLADLSAVRGGTDTTRCRTSSEDQCHTTKSRCEETHTTR
jgi:hypothetical protein